MVEKQISLLQEQLKKLEAKQFDLEAWKRSTAVLLGGIFGDQSLKVKQLEEIKYHYGSWTLRDASGKSGSLESCKKQGEEILSMAILELEAKASSSGVELPVTGTKTIDLDDLLEVVEAELTVSQHKALKAILAQDLTVEEIRKGIVEKLQSFGSETSFRIVSNLLTNSVVKENF